MLIIDINAGTGGLGILYRVDPFTGERTVLSDFGVGANQGSNPVRVAVYPVIHAPVGGEMIPIDKLSVFLSSSWILILLILILPVAFILYRKRDVTLKILNTLVSRLFDYRLLR